MGHKRLIITNTIANIEELRELEHFIAVRGGQITEVKTNRNGLEVTYVLI